MLATAILLSILAAALVLRVCAAQVQDGESLHDLTVRVHTLRNEYLRHLRGDEIIEVEEVSGLGDDADVAGRIDDSEPAQTQMQAA